MNNLCAGEREQKKSLSAKCQQKLIWIKNFFFCSFFLSHFWRLLSQRLLLVWFWSQMRENNDMKNKQINNLSQIMKIHSNISLFKTFLASFANTTCKNKSSNPSWETYRFFVRCFLCRQVQYPLCRLDRRRRKTKQEWRKVSQLTILTEPL